MTGDTDWLLDALVELDDLEHRCAIAATRLPDNDPDVTLLRHDIATRRTFLLDALAALRAADAAAGVETLH
jgi:hypothetical protein